MKIGMTQENLRGEIFHVAELAHLVLVVTMSLRSGGFRHRGQLVIVIIMGYLRLCSSISNKTGRLESRLVDRGEVAQHSIYNIRLLIAVHVHLVLIIPRVVNITFT